MNLSTGICDLGDFPRMKALYSTARSLDESAILYRRSLDENTIQQVVKEQVVKEQVVKEQVVRATTTVNNSLKKKEKPPKRGARPSRKDKIFLIGKELKTKNLRQTATERGNRDGNKTQPKTPDSLRREANQAAGAAPTRVPSMTDSLEVQVLYPA